MGTHRAAFAPSAAVAVDRQTGAKLSLHAVRDGRRVLPGLRCGAGGGWLRDPAGRAVAITWHRMQAVLLSGSLSVDAMLQGCCWLGQRLRLS